MNRVPAESYEETRQFSYSIGNQLIQVVSKPGLSDWNALPPASRLLAEYPHPLPTDRILLLGCHHGALAVALAHLLKQGKLWVTDVDFIALEMTRQTLELNHIESVGFQSSIDLNEIEDQKINKVYIQLPKGRKLARRWLLQANQILIPGGSLFLAGSNKSGIRSAIKDSQDLFGDGQILAYKKGNRIVQIVKRSTPPPYPEWTQEPGVASGTWIEFSLNFSAHNYIIHSLPGVFSTNHLDEGTRMLLEVASIPSGGRVLDVGCGYGIVGLYASIHGASWVDLVDNNLLAIASARETLAINEISNATVFAGDLLQPVHANTYDLILSNPPFHAGLAVDYQIAYAMIRQSYQLLNPNGKIIIVANKFIHYDHLINAIFGNVTCLKESGRFHVLSGLKSGKVFL